MLENTRGTCTFILLLHLRNHKHSRYLYNHTASKVYVERTAQLYSAWPCRIDGVMFNPGKRKARWISPSGGYVKFFNLTYCSNGSHPGRLQPLG
jgi:hypothetical protein